MKKLIFLLLLIPSLAFGAGPYYVRTDGHDTNCNGSVNVADSVSVRPNCAFLTIGKSESVAAAGDTININAGTYNEILTINVSGTSDNRITFLGVGTVVIKQVFLTGADYITLNNLTIGSASTVTYSHLHVDRNSDYVIITGCTINGGSAQYVEGLSLFGNYGYVTNTTVTGIKGTYCISVGEGSATSPGSTDITVTNSLITDNIETDAFRVHGTNHTISYNEVRNNKIVTNDNHSDFVQWFPNDNNCANSYDVKNILIEGNYVHDIEAQLFFGNNVCYTYGVVVSNITFRNNIFYNVGMTGSTYGNNNTITNLNFYNNVFHKVGYMYYIYGSVRTYSSHALQYASGTVGEVKNNVFLECGDEPSVNYKGWYAGAGTITKDYNYVAGPSYAAKSGFSETYGINGVVDPKFINEAGHDYRLQSSSPLKDVGATIASFSVDKNGISRPQGPAWDIGAFEFGNEPASPRNLRIE